MTQTLSTSVRLVERAKQRDPEAWERLARLYGPLVYSWVRRNGLQPDDAADVAQDVFRSVFQAIDSFDPERPDGRFRSWLYGITRHRLLDWFRCREAEPAGAGGSTANARMQELPALADEISGLSSIHSLAMRALRLIERDFQPQTWQAFWQVAIDGHAPQHVAENLGLSVASVYQARSRVLQRLRDEMGDGPG